MGRIAVLASLAIGLAACSGSSGDAPPPAEPAATPEAAPAAPPPAEPAPEAASEAAPEADAAAPSVEFSGPRAVAVGDAVIACYVDGKVVPGSECPSGKATLVGATSPDAPAAPTLQQATLESAECGRSAARTEGDVVAAGEALTIQALPNDSAQYRGLIGPEVGVKDPANAPGFIIDQLLRVDLDGDGAQEVLFAAQGAVGVRRVRGDAVATSLFPDPRGEEPVGVPRIVGLVDVEGDGSSEVVVSPGEPLAGLGPQWSGHWIVSLGGDAPVVLAAAGCDREAPARPPGD